MRRVFFLCLVLAFVFTSPAWATDISGNWALEMTGRQGGVTMDLVIKAAGENLTVKGKHSKLGEMEGTGTLKDNAINMTLTATGQMKIGFNFTGTVDGNKMSGTREVVMSGGGRGGQEGGQTGQGNQGAQGGQGGQAGQGGQGQGGQAGQGAQAGGQGSGQAISNEWSAEKQ